MSVVLGLLLVEAIGAAPDAQFPLPEPMPARYLRTLAYNPQGYDPSANEIATRILLGDLLFHSPQILGARAVSMGMSCATCHPHGAAHTQLHLAELSDRAGNVDLTTAHFNDSADNGRRDPVNIPSLRGSRYTAPYGRDGRTASLRSFIADVISVEFDGEPLTQDHSSSLLEYVRDLDFQPNPYIDARGKLTDRANAAAKRGEVLFHSGVDGNHAASCASCHRPSSYFRDGLVHRLGSGDSASPFGLDDGYETPTLLGIAETAPYFHDGRLATLGDVVAWFDRTSRLGMTSTQRADLVAYLEAVGAGEKSFDDRPFGRIVAERLAYLSLLVSGPWRDQRHLWSMALSAVLDDLTARPKPIELDAQIDMMLRRLDDIARRANAGDSLSELRLLTAAWHHDMLKLAAHWTAP